MENTTLKSPRKANITQLSNPFWGQMTDLSQTYVLFPCFANADQMNKNPATKPTSNRKQNRIVPFAASKKRQLFPELGKIRDILRLTAVVLGASQYGGETMAQKTLSQRRENKQSWKIYLTIKFTLVSYISNL